MRVKAPDFSKFLDGFPIKHPIEYIDPIFSDEDLRRIRETLERCDGGSQQGDWEAAARRRTDENLRSVFGL